MMDSEKLYINTSDSLDVVTLQEILNRYVAINETTEGFFEYVNSGFINGNEVEYIERGLFYES